MGVRVVTCLADHLYSWEHGACSATTSWHHLSCDGWFSKGFLATMAYSIFMLSMAALSLVMVFACENVGKMFGGLVLASSVFKIILSFSIAFTILGPILVVLACIV